MPLIEFAREELEMIYEDVKYWLEYDGEFTAFRLAVLGKIELALQEGTTNG